MKKSLLIASSFVALFTSLGANAYTIWRGSEDLSGVNAQIGCDGSMNCTLSPVTGTTITDDINLFQTGPLGDFEFASGGLISYTGKTSTNSGLMFNTQDTIASVLLNGDVDVTGIAGSFSFNATILQQM